MKKDAPRTILFFDGICVLCNWFVKYIFKRDRSGEIYFSQLQSDFAEEALHKFGFEPKKLESMVLLHDDSIYLKGEGALKLIELLPFGIHKILLIGKIFPLFLKNSIYDFIASIRYKIFGKKEQCEIPLDDIRQRYV